MIVLKILLFFLVCLAAIALIAFCIYAVPWLVFIKPLKRRHKFKKVLKQHNLNQKSLLEKIKNDLIIYPAFSELETVKLKVSHSDGPHGGSMRARAKKLTITSDWIIDYFAKEYSSFYEYKPFCWTIGHELGHLHYYDIWPVHISRQKRLLQVMKEVRADNYGCKVSELSPQEAHDYILEELTSNRVSLNSRLVVTHPSWADRLSFMLKYPVYDKELEKQAKSIYGKKLHLKETVLDRLTLIN